MSDSFHLFPNRGMPYLRPPPSNQAASSQSSLSLSTSDLSVHSNTSSSSNIAVLARKLVTGVTPTSPEVAYQRWNPPPSPDGSPRISSSYRPRQTSDSSPGGRKGITASAFAAAKQERAALRCASPTPGSPVGSWAGPTQHRPGNSVSSNTSNPYFIGASSLKPPDASSASPGRPRSGSMLAHSGGRDGKDEGGDENAVRQALGRSQRPSSQPPSQRGSSKNGIPVLSRNRVPSSTVFAPNGPTSPWQPQDDRPPSPSRLSTRPLTRVAKSSAPPSLFSPVSPEASEKGDQADTPASFDLGYYARAGLASPPGSQPSAERGEHQSSNGAREAKPIAGANSKLQAPGNMPSGPSSPQKNKRRTPSGKTATMLATSLTSSVSSDGGFVALPYSSTVPACPAPIEHLPPTPPLFARSAERAPHPASQADGLKPPTVGTLSSVVYRGPSKASSLSTGQEDSWVQVEPSPRSSWSGGDRSMNTEEQESVQVLEASRVVPIKGSRLGRQAPRPLAESRKPTEPLNLSPKKGLVAWPVFGPGSPPSTPAPVQEPSTPVGSPTPGGKSLKSMIVSPRPLSPRKPASSVASGKPPSSRSRASSFWGGSNSGASSAPGSPGKKERAAAVAALEAEKARRREELEAMRQEYLKQGLMGGSAGIGGGSGRPETEKERVEREFQRLMDAMQVPEAVKVKMATLDHPVKSAMLKSSTSASLSSHSFIAQALQLSTSRNAAPSSAATTPTQAEVNKKARMTRSKSGGDLKGLNILGLGFGVPKRAKQEPDEGDRRSTGRPRGYQGHGKTQSVASASPALGFAASSSPSAAPPSVVLKDEKDGSAWWAMRLKTRSYRDLDASELRKLRVNLRTQAPTWTAEFVVFGGYTAMLRRSKELLEVEWREEQHDDQVLHELLRCFKALLLTDPGKGALMTRSPGPFIQFVELLYSDKKPGDLGCRQHLIELIQGLFELYPATSNSPQEPVLRKEDWGKGIQVVPGPVPAPFPLPSSPFTSSVQVSGPSAPLQPSSSPFEQAGWLPDSSGPPLQGATGGNSILPGAPFGLDGRPIPSAHALVRALLIGPPDPKRENMTEIVAVAHRPRLFKRLMTEFSGVLMDYFWIFCHSDNKFWDIKKLDQDEIEAPKVPSGMTGGVEYEAMQYCTTVLRLINDLARTTPSQSDARTLHHDLFASGIERCLLTLRKSSTTYYPGMHLELARYISVARSCGFDVPASILRHLAGVAPDEYLLKNPLL